LQYIELKLQKYQMRQSCANAQGSRIFLRLPCGDAKASPEAAGFVRSKAALPPLRIRNINIAIY
jgi:hypothetical protein